MHYIRYGGGQTQLMGNRQQLQICSFVSIPVTVVEADLLDNNVAEEMPDGGEEGGELVAALVATPDR